MDLSSAADGVARCGGQRAPRLDQFETRNRLPIAILGQKSDGFGLSVKFSRHRCAGDRSGHKNVNDGHSWLAEFVRGLSG